MPARDRRPARFALDHPPGPFTIPTLREAGERFQREVSSALGSNAEVLDYVNRLEEAYDSGEDQSPGIQDASTGDILRDVEDFLRQQRDDE
ncbi:MAG: hypothetical protein U5Q44_12925 [Dehalococcoidia bacterium]|nr:hypothetical protein [Dehalococcoidia bacterium]